jgi:NADPH-dependent ferric siderophore reductase
MSRLADLINGLVTTAVRVQVVEDLGPRFRRIEVEGEGGQALPFKPGDKVQIRVADWAMRTYTPFSIDGGRMQLLAFDHEGGTPASRWMRTLAVGDRVQLFGPRTSIVLADVGARAGLFGDETSIALALAQRSVARDAMVILESSVADETAAVLARFSLEATVVPRVESDDHLRRVSELIVARDAPLVLTGRAKAIQTLRMLLGAEKRRIAKTKAYWALGKAGLD